MSRVVVIMTVACLTSVSSSWVWGRTWTDPTGKFSIDAEFVSYDPPRSERVKQDGKTVVKRHEAKVRLRKADGKEIAVPLARLCDADQKHVRGLYREMQKKLQEEEKDRKKKELLAPFLGTWEGPEFDLIKTLATLGLAKKREDGGKDFTSSEFVIFRPDYTGTVQLRNGDAIVSYKLKFQVNAKTKILSFSSDGATGIVKVKDKDTLFLRGKFIGGTTMLGTEFKRVPNAGK